MGGWESESDERVLAAAPRDPVAFAAFYHRYERSMLAFFLRRTGDAELAADLTAEVFAAALDACGRFRAGEAPATAWLFGIAQHKLAKSRRRGVVEDRARRRLGMAPLVIDDDDLERIERLAGEDDAGEGLLESLPPDQRDAIRARILEERSYEEIAGELRCSQAVVRKRVSRGLARLRNQLEKESR
ncbi:MAG TPA: RNA polymerase sigma factor [Solirubrobacteraceae bacterium]|nr:RNA polymerase sigma factor [Solirubrobacteraceae bacterium]